MIENTKNVLPIHISGMENIKGQQTINAILDTMNHEIDNHKWVVTTQDYTILKFEKYLESGSSLTVDQKPKVKVPIVGTHNGRKVYIGDLDVQGNLVISDLALRDNVNTIAKSWEVLTASTKVGALQGTTWDSESFRVGIRDPLPLTEVKSIPNDINDPVYGTTIYNKETTSYSGVTLDTKTFEKSELSYYISYPETTEYNGNSEGITQSVLAHWMDLGRVAIGAQTYFPQITTLNTKACWDRNQIYGLFKWENAGYITLLSYQRFASYDAFYDFVSKYPSTNGKDGIGVMIPSWRFIQSKFVNSKCTMKSTNVTTRRLLSEEFDKRSSGIVKVDITYRT